MFYPLQLFADWLTYRVFGIAYGTYLAEAIRFFIFDAIKIFLLLLVVVFVVSLVRTFVPPERIRDVLARRGRCTGNVLAAALGIFTPFCTCSAIPLFLGFVEAGVPLGVTFSFLVASPMINEIALVMLFALFGWRIAVLYIASGLLIAVAAGIVIGKLKAEHLVEAFIHEQGVRTPLGSAAMSWKDRLQYARGYTVEIVGKVWPYVLAGVGVGAWIHGYVPADFLARYAGSGVWYAVPLAALIGIPLYANAAGVIPLVGALTEKGVAIGTTLAFMMAVTGLSLPEFIILKKVMKARLIAIFAGVVGAGIVLTGYLFNWIL